MSWLRKALVQLALWRSDAALVKAAGGTARSVRGMTLDPRFQFIEAQARKRGVDWASMSPAQMRAQTEAGVALFGGAPVRNVRTERVYITGRSHSVPGRLYLPLVRDNAAAMLVYFHFGGGVVGSLECCDRLCGLIAREAGAPVLSVDYRLAPEHKFPAGLEDAMAAWETPTATSQRVASAAESSAGTGANCSPK